MAKLRYLSPIVLNSNGVINMTLSQNGVLSEKDVAKWDDFWADAEEYVKEYYPDFDINNSSTWPAGFLGVEGAEENSEIYDSWWILLEEPTNP